MNQSGERKRAYVFFDTMIFIHCLPIEQIDVPKILGEASITLIVPRITIQELDKHKNTHPNRKIKDRATTRLKVIQSCLASSEKEIRPGVGLELLMARPSRDFEEHGLNLDWPDDELIAGVLKCKLDHPSDRVVLVSHDVGPTLTAIQLGIEAMEIPDEWRIPPEEDPLIKENKRLKNEILKLKKAQPNLILRLTEMRDSDKHINFEIEPPSEIQVPDKEKIIAELLRIISQTKSSSHQRGRPT